VPRNDDISLILAKAKLNGMLPDVKDYELDALQGFAQNLFGDDAALSAIYSRSRPGNRWVALGTSLSRGFTDDAPIAGKTNVAIQASWPTFTSVLSGQRINLIKNAGITGNLVSQMLTRFDTDVTPYAPNIVTVDGGTNEFLTGVPFATFQTNFIALITKIRSIGAVPVIASILPNTTQRQLAATWVKWQRTYAAQQGIEFLDFWNLLVDPTSGILNSTAASGDGTHPGVGGYLAMANYVIPRLTALMPDTVPTLITDNQDSDSLLANPLFLGSPVGGVAPSWTAQTNPSGATYSVGTDANVALGNLQIIQRNATASDTILQQGVGLSGNPNVSIGERIIVSGKLYTQDFSGTKSGNDIIRIDFGVGTPRDIYLDASWLNNTNGGRFYHEAIVPAGATQIKLMYIGNAGSGTAKLGQITVLNATRLNMVVGSAY
jgi:lysophospholipase L1-like esterase